MRDFVNIHAHTNLGSMLDALISTQDLFSKVAEFGQKAVAVTDHGTLASHFDAFQISKKMGIKFIPGCEMYFVNSVSGNEKRRHLVLLAQNHNGYKNLLKLNFIGFQHRDIVMGRIYPKIDWKILEEHSEGLICTSACLNGPISYLITAGKESEAEEAANRFVEIFKDRFYLELHPHLLKTDDIDQNKINNTIINIANKYGIPLVAAIDTHYVTKKSEKNHDILLAIKDKKAYDDPYRHRYGIDEFYVKTGDEVYDFLYKHYGMEVAEEAVSNTVKIANLCEQPDYMEVKGNHLPKFSPKNENDYENFKKWFEVSKLPKDMPEDVAYMRFKCVLGFKNKFKHLSKEDKELRWNRVKKELEVLEGNHFSSYMLIVADFIQWAKDNEILVGYGRGCLSGETLVLTENGYKELKNICVGDKVYTHTGELKSVLETFSYPKNKLVSVKTGHNSINLTPDHMVLGSKNNSKFEWLPISELEKGNGLFIPFYNRQIGNYPKQLVYDDLKIEVDEDSLYVLGALIANGNVLSCLALMSGISYFGKDGNAINHRIEKWFKRYNLKYSKMSYYGIKGVNNIQLARILRPLFLSDDYKQRHLPEWFRFLPDNLLNALLSGLLYRNSLYVRDRNLILEIKELASYLGLSVSIRKNNRLIINKNKPTKNGYSVIIDSIDEASEDFVYDLHVEDNLSYVTSEFAVHNSVGGCLVAYLLGIHYVDPIEYDILFERFQNAYKKDLPDIDTDFTSAGKDLVQEYCRKKYGYDKCAQVSNINTYTPRNVIPDLVRSMRNVIPGLIKEGENYVKVSDAIKEAIPEKDENDNKVKTIDEALRLSPRLQQFAEESPELMEYAKNLVGLPKEFSTHAAGMVISDVPLTDFVPVRIDKNGVNAIQYEKNRCEASGLVKMDFLAINTLDIIDETFKNIKRLGVAGPSRIEDIPLNDEETYKMISRGHTRCVFQLGTSGMMVSLCKEIKPKNIVDIAVINTLGRPSSKNERNEYVARRSGSKKITYLHPSLEKALHKTYGLCIMEDQLMSVAREVAGWDLNKADGLRKLTKLKDKGKDLALKLEVEFIEGAMKTHDMSYELAKKIWSEVVAKFSGYGFNFSHAILYSTNGYITAYLKCHYPAAFLAAYLKVKSVLSGINRDDEINNAKNESRRLGIKFVPPDINQSGSGYELLDDKTIVMGFTSIKGLGEKAIEDLTSKQPFSSILDFFYRINARIINKSKLEAMASAGCFDSFGVSRKAVHDEGKKFRDKLMNFLKKKNKDGYDDQMAIDDFTLKLPDDEWPIKEILINERSVLGELISGSINDLYPGFFTGNGTTPIAKLKSLPDRYNIVVEFVVKELLREFKIKTGRYKGQPMIKYKVEDEFGSETELTVWPSCYDSAKRLMVEGRPVRAFCQVSEFNQVKTIMLREIERVYNDS